METKFTSEQINKAKECKGVEEIIALAKENGIELTEAEATNLFAKLNPTSGKLSDSELETVAGGCGKKGSSTTVCIFCGSENAQYRRVNPDVYYYLCLDCHKMFS